MGPKVKGCRFGETNADDEAFVFTAIVRRV